MRQIWSSCTCMLFFSVHYTINNSQNLNFVWCTEFKVSRNTHIYILFFIFCGCNLFMFCCLFAGSIPRVCFFSVPWRCSIVFSIDSPLPPSDLSTLWSHNDSHVYQPDDHRNVVGIQERRGQKEAHRLRGIRPEIKDKVIYARTRVFL